IGYCLLSLSMINLIRRDQVNRLAHLEQALDVLGDDRFEHLDLKLQLLGNRLLTLAILDRFTEAERTLGQARDLAERLAGYDGVARFHAPAAVLYYWTGRWDDALVEVDAARDLAGNPKAAPLADAVVALIAVHRDD